MSGCGCLPCRCALGWCARSGALAGPLKWIADRLEGFGSDRGGMVVYAIGRDSHGRAVERRWTLIAEAGDGPQVPPTPALLLALRLLGGGTIAPGARPAVGLLTLGEVEAGLSSLRIRFGRSERPAPPLLERAMAEELLSASPGMATARRHPRRRSLRRARARWSAGPDFCPGLLPACLAFRPATSVDRRRRHQGEDRSR